MNRVLVISNNCFSKTDSNGRTLGNFFLGWDKTCLAQFFIQNAEPDFDYCENYFRVTDAEALHAFKTGKCTGGQVPAPKEKKVESPAAFSAPNKRARNALTMLARDIVWGSERWKKCGFSEWVNNFAPTVVLLQAGDCPFMYRLATKIAKKCNAQLVIYNSEGYFFKKFDYFRSHGLPHFFYPIFRKRLTRALKKAYAITTHAFYSCDELEKAYHAHFPVSSETIYTASELIPRASVPQNAIFTASYCGNLGLERHLRLIEVAKELQKLSPEIHLDVYGPTNDQTVLDDFTATPGLKYHGRVSYEEVKKIIARSDLIVHVESFDAFYREDLKFAFSTKIADSLASGTCFLLYAPENLACARYLKKHNAAYVVTEKDELTDTLSLLVTNTSAREKHIKNALALAEEKHRAIKNKEKFQSLLKRL